MATEAKPLVKLLDEENLPDTMKALINFEEDEKISDDLLDFFGEPLMPLLEMLRYFEINNPKMFNDLVFTFLGDIYQSLHPKIGNSLTLKDVYDSYKQNYVEKNLEGLTNEEKAIITSELEKHNLPFELRDDYLVYVGELDKIVDNELKLGELILEDESLMYIVDHSRKKLEEDIRNKLLHNKSMTEAVDEISNNDHYVRREAILSLSSSVPKFMEQRGLTVRRGLINGREGNQEENPKKKKPKKKRNLRRFGRKALAILAVGLMVGGATAVGGVLNHGILPEPKATNWNDLYWDHVFFHLNNTTENKNFVSNFLTVYNASDWQHYNASRELVTKGGVSPMWLARYIAGNMLSSEEFEILPNLYATNSSLENHGNLTMILSEVNNLQLPNGGINSSEAQNITEIVASYENLSPIEEKSLFLTPMNKTTSPPITSANKNQNTLKVSQEDINAMKLSKPMDSGDLLWWLWTNFSVQKGIDVTDLNQTKILWAYMSVFDGFLNHDHSWTDEQVVNYISEQFNEFGLSNLSAIANFPDSLLWLQQKIWPQTLQTHYNISIGTNEFGSGVFWINHTWNGTQVDAYKQARQLWKDYNFDSVVVGKDGSTALTDLENSIDENFTTSGTEPPLGNFTLFYENFFSKFLQGQKVPLDCRGVSTTAAFLLRAQNHLYLDNNTVTNETPAYRIPLTAIQIQMPTHTDIAYLGKNVTDKHPEAVLSDFGWSQFSGDKSQYQIQVPAAFWYEIEGPSGQLNGKWIHTRYGQQDVNIRGDDIYLPWHNTTAIPANETNQQTNYSKIIDYVKAARLGCVKEAFGYGSDPFTRGHYDLLNKDDVAVPEFQNIYLPIATAVAMGIGFSRYKRRKED